MEFLLWGDFLGWSLSNPWGILEITKFPVFKEGILRTFFLVFSLISWNSWRINKLPLPAFLETSYIISHPQYSCHFQWSINPEQFLRRDRKNNCWWPCSFPGMSRKNNKSRHQPSVIELTFYADSEIPQILLSLSNSNYEWEHRSINFIADQCEYIIPIPLEDLRFQNRRLDMKNLMEI